MENSTLYKLTAVLMVFVAFITLGGLGNIAVQDHFYWIAFIANIVVYAAIIYNLIKASREE